MASLVLWTPIAYCKWTQTVNMGSDIYTSYKHTTYVVESMPQAEQNTSSDGENKSKNELDQSNEVEDIEDSKKDKMEQKTKSKNDKELGKEYQVEEDKKNNSLKDIDHQSADEQNNVIMKNRIK